MTIPESRAQPDGRSFVAFPSVTQEATITMAVIHTRRPAGYRDQREDIHSELRRRDRT